MSAPASALSVKATAAALHFHERVLRDWCKRGHVRAVRHDDSDRWWIPAPEVERIARLLMTTPDWDAAAEVDL